jgi:hypothetical protein
MKKRLKILIVLAAVLLFAASSWATSVRQTPIDPAYDVHDFDRTPQDADHFYSGGMDLVYVNGVRHFLTLWNTNSNFPYSPIPVGNSITLSLYDYNGNLVMDIATYTDIRNRDADPTNDVMTWPQSVKLDPDGNTIWVSYTSSSATGWPQNLSDYFCTVAWDHTLQVYSVGPVTMTEQFYHLGNWEMEWSTDPDTSADSMYKEPFVSGLIPPLTNQTNGIFLYTSAAGLQLVIDTGGNSAGFAFDLWGNLWYGDYNFYVSRNIYMWTAAQIRDAVKYSTVLDTDDAVCTIPTPYNLGGCDVERDADGNVYFSLNGGTSSYTKGQVVRVDNDGQAPWPTGVTTITESVDDYDWCRTLAFDGLGDLATPGKQEASNRLYVDMDQPYQGSTTPTIVGICATGDADFDGVPDALDNCWQAANANQDDSEAGGYGANGWYGPDGHGDACDSAPYVFNDCDGDGIADVRDWSWDTPDDQCCGMYELTMVSSNWLSSPPGPDMDHDGDGRVGMFELTFLLDHWLEAQPLHPWWP